MIYDVELPVTNDDELFGLLIPSRDEFFAHYGYVYRITNLFTGAVYVGQHKYDFTESWYSYMGSCHLLDEEIDAYGLSLFKKEFVCFTDSKETAVHLEGYHISRAFESAPICYNSSNAFGLARDSLVGSVNFAFRASFRPKASLKEYIRFHDDWLKDDSLPLSERARINAIRDAYRLALKFKIDRLKATGRRDSKDR